MIPLGSDTRLRGLLFPQLSHSDPASHPLMHSRVDVRHKTYMRVQHDRIQ